MSETRYAGAANPNNSENKLENVSHNKQIYEKIIAKQSSFHDKYYEFLSELIKCPKEKRMELYEKSVDTDKFAEDLLEAAQGDKFKQLKKQLETMGKTIISLDDVIFSNENYDKYLKENLDDLVVMETLKETINDYKDINKSFCGLFNNIYKRKINTEKNAIIFDKIMKGRVDDRVIYSKEKKANIVLAKFSIDRKLKEISDKTEEEKNETVEKLVNVAIEESKGGLAKKDLNLILDILSDKFSFIYLDQSVDKDEDGLRKGDTIGKDDEDLISVINGPKMLIEEKMEIVQEMVPYWGGLVKTFEEKNTRDIERATFYRAYSTRAFLHLLKLRECTDEMKADLVKKMGKTEADKYIKEKEEKKCKGYIRWNYVMDNPSEPAGDPEWYEAMEQYNYIIIEILFSEGLLHKSFSDKPKDLYDIYSWPLVEEPVFQDSFICDAISMEKGTYSKNKKKAENDFEEYWKEYRKAKRNDSTSFLTC